MYDNTASAEAAKNFVLKGASLSLLMYMTLGARAAATTALFRIARATIAAPRRATSPRTSTSVVADKDDDDHDARVASAHRFASPSPDRRCPATARAEASPRPSRVAIVLGPRIVAPKVTIVIIVTRSRCVKRRASLRSPSGVDECRGRVLTRQLPSHVTALDDARR